MYQFLIQRFTDNSPCVETRTVRHVALLNNWIVQNATLDEVGQPWSHFQMEKTLIPVGNVPFVQAWARRQKIELRNPDTYPDELQHFLGRTVTLTTLANALKRNDVFIKPAEVKSFDGFCLNAQSEHAAEQRRRMIELPKTTPVYISDICHFNSEWRCYFNDSATLLAVVRYDQQEDEHVPTPDASIINKLGSTFKKDHPFVLDVGVTEHGTTVLVEANDAWAIGFYKGMDPKLYTQMLVNRWQSLTSLKPSTTNSVNANLSPT